MAKRYAIYCTGHTPAKRLGAVTALGRPTAIKKATEQHKIPNTWLEVVLLTSRKSKQVKVRGGL